MTFLLPSVLAFPSYRDRVPNGYVNGQATGHAGSSPFRWAFRSTGYTWTTALCNEDTDGDGQSNGVELGDPCCVWTQGAVPAFTTDISIPGDPNSVTSRPATCELPTPPSSSPSPYPPSPPPLYLLLQACLLFQISFLHLIGV